MPNYTQPAKWPRPEPKDLRQLIEFLAPFVMWLDPEIVEAIVTYNNQRRSDWEITLETLSGKPVPSAAYLWDNGACVFPGIRRSTGDEARNYFGADGCLKTDSSNNWYPNLVWRYAMIGKQKFDEEDKAEAGLAHLFPHKDESRDAYLAKAHAASIQNLTLPPSTGEIEGSDPSISHTVEEFSHWLTGSANGFEKLNQPFSLAGLFTSAANMCFLPAELMKPTDAQGPLLLVLLLKAQDLYGDFCNLFPYGLELGDPASLLEQSGIGLNSIDKLKWHRTFTGNIRHVNKLNQYREQHFAELVSKKRMILSESSATATTLITSS
jgi:hypothetical protein